MSALLKNTDARKMLHLVSEEYSLYETPGVTSSMTPRFTRNFVFLGSSNCSQMATRCPALTNLGR